ncbi:MAG: hypothetical protein MMC33_000374 [Icmadophila ericetorum]|nr:hypothetical protein [Icmadophila ericetorum]
MPPSSNPITPYLTSPLLPPLPHAFLRLVIAAYILLACLLTILRPLFLGTPLYALRSFVYFTNLTYWSMGFYFLVSGLGTLEYALGVGKSGMGGGGRRGGKVIQVGGFRRMLVVRMEEWGPWARWVWGVWYTTVVSFPWLVTIVYWGVLYPGVWFEVEWDAWVNVSKHALNVLFSTVEIIFPRTTLPPLLHIPIILVLLVLYLSYALAISQIFNFYVYFFLNPSSVGSWGVVVLFVLGIALVACLLFVVVRGFVLMRMLIFARLHGEVLENGEEEDARKGVLGEGEWDVEMGLLGGEDEDEIE